MSSIINYNELFYDDDEHLYKQRKAFNAQLQSFLCRKAGGPHTVPMINGRPIDLFALYRQVTQLGGWSKVSTHNKWHEVLSSVQLGDDCVGADYALRMIYMRYLARFEQKFTFGTDTDDEDDSSYSRSRSKVSSSYGFNSRYYDNSITNVGAKYQANSLPTAVNFVRSLESGLPNEVDFAVNTLMLISFGGGVTAEDINLRQLTSLLLAHVGIFEEGPGSYRAVYFGQWLKYTNRRFVEFWNEHVLDDKVRQLLGPDEAAVVGECEISYSDQDQIKREIMKRIQQVFCILRNFSMQRNCVQVLASCKALVTLILVGIHSDLCQLVSYASDLMAFMATTWRLDSIETPTTQLLFSCIYSGLQSKDRMRLSRQIEVVGHLCSCAENKQVMLEFVDSDVIRCIVNGLLVKDVLICLNTLECMLSLSQMGEAVCDLIVQQPSAIAILVDLVTVEASTYAPAGLVGLQIVEMAKRHQHVNAAPPPGQPYRSDMAPRFGQVQNARWSRPITPSPLATQSAGSSSGSIRTSAINCTTVRLPNARYQSVPSTSTTVIFSQQQQQQQQQQIQQQQSQPVVVQTNIRQLTASPMLQHRSMPRPEIFKGPAVSVYQDQQVEAVALKWIKENCVADSNSIVSRGELYAAYARAVHGRQTLVVSASTFSNLIRQLFPLCVQRQLEGPNSKSGLLQIEGIRFVGSQRNHVTSPTPVAAQHPIMQQMLCRNNKPSSVEPKRPDSVGTTDSYSLPNTPDSFASSSGCSQDVNIAATAAVPAVNVKKKQQPCCRTGSSSSGSRLSSSGGGGGAVSLNGSTVSSSQPATSGQCQLEVCHPALEATSLIEANDAHEARIVRVENKAAAARSTGAVYSKAVNANGDLSEGENSTASSLAAATADPAEAQLPWHGADDPPPPEQQQQRRRFDEDRHMLNGTDADGNRRAATPDTDTVKQNVPLGQKNLHVLLNKPDTVGAVWVPVNGGGVSRKRTNSDDADHHCSSLQVVDTRKRQIICTSNPAARQATSSPSVVQAQRPLAATSPSVRLSQRQTPPPLMAANAALRYVCEWNQCKQLFQSAQGVNIHVYKSHISGGSQKCMWANCDDTVRKKWSLVAHVQEVHCNEQVLRAAAMRRAELLLTGRSKIPEPRAPPHPGYAPDAAMSAIRRHTLVNMPKDLPEENEGPVTKSIRFTSALVLRNLAMNSENARRKILFFENRLVHMAFSRTECNRALAQCLGALRPELNSLRFFSFHLYVSLVSRENIADFILLTRQIWSCCMAEFLEIIHCPCFDNIFQQMKKNIYVYVCSMCIPAGDAILPLVSHILHFSFLMCYIKAY
ncbi:ARID domain-containing protein C08B11.3 [Trichinella sp. T8]|nr:ARID domain-containing protein C08B11.3 [Trichinella sp. T8]